MSSTTMNALEAQLDYPFDAVDGASAPFVPAAGTTFEVAPGVFWHRMGLPFALNHINLWLLDEMRNKTRDDLQDASLHHTPGWTAVDCGIADDATRAAWQNVFAAHLGGRPISRVLATHCHPDHVGLADWLCQRWQAPLWMSAGEYAFTRMMSAGLPGVDGTAMLPHFARHGLTDPHMLAQLGVRKSYYPTLVPAVPHSYVRLQDGQTVHIGGYAWRVITGFGHSPEHVALYCAARNLLISGDMVLPRISTNVSVFAIEPLANPVQQYLDSLAKFADLPADVLVLPSHGRPFRGLHTRIDQLNTHHAERLAEVATACTTARSAAEIVPIMFRRELDGHQLSFALGEALAHLHKLWFDGVLQRLPERDGVVRFQVC